MTERNRWAPAVVDRDPNLLGQSNTASGGSAIDQEAVELRRAGLVLDQERIELERASSCVVPADPEVGIVRIRQELLNRINLSNGSNVAKSRNW